MNEQQTPQIPYQFKTISEAQSLQQAEHFYAEMDTRRSVRHFSDAPVARATIEAILKTASSAPSGAHKQPWTFCAISNPEMKKAIREAAEKEEYENYHGRMSDSWLEDLQKFETNWQKPFLETVPWIIVVFRRIYEVDEAGEKQNNYYVNESVGLAAGFLLAAIHKAGLASLTHTPSPMNFLAKLLNRPKNEKPFLLIPVGFPAENCEVPLLHRKNLEEMAIFFT